MSTGSDEGYFNASLQSLEFCFNFSLLSLSALHYMKILFAIKTLLGGVNYSYRVFYFEKL